MSPIEQLISIIERTRVNLSSEKAAQADLAEALDKAGVTYLREVRLAPGDIIDFLIDETSAGAIGIELKLNRSVKAATFRQLERYAKSPRVRSMILATNRAMGLPALIDGKPVYLASMGRAWL